MNIHLDNPLLLIALSSGIIFMMTGFFNAKVSAKKINGLYGYRTFNSIKTQKWWDFSQKYASTEMIELGALLALSSISGSIFKLDDKIGIFLRLTLMILMVILFYQYELKKHLRISLQTSRNNTMTMATINYFFLLISNHP